MDNVNSLSYRVLRLYEYLKNNGKVDKQKEFCKKIGISESFFTEIKKGRSGITHDGLQNISEEYSEFKEWLLTGHGGYFNKIVSENNINGDRNEVGEPPPQFFTCRECKKKDEEILKWRNKYDDMTAKYLAVLEEIKDKKVS